MNHFALAVLFIFSLAAQANTQAVKVECKAWGQNGGGEETSDVYFHEIVEFKKGNTIAIIFNREETRIVPVGEDYKDSEIGKKFVILETCKNEGQDESLGECLSIFKGTIDPDRVPQQNDYLRLPSSKKFHFTTVEYETGTVLRCKTL